MNMYNPIEVEKEILEFWKKNKIFDKLREKNKGKKAFSFFDGPITANNPMGVHHAWGRTYKDLFQRFKAMQGYDQRYQNGFDCQGLWVEVEVEKELGFNFYCVAGLVIGRVHALLLRHDDGTALGAHHYLVLGLLEVLHVHEPLVGARGKQRGLVHEVGEVRAGKTGRAAGNNIGIHVIRHRHLAHVHLENLLASADVRQRHVHLAVETARAQQGRVEHVRTVGRGNDDNALGAFETVHLDK